MNASGPAAAIVGISREFLTRYPRYFALLLLVLVIEGVVVTAAVLALVPLADFLLDPALSSPSGVTVAFVAVLRRLQVAPSFWAFALLFVAANLVKGLLDIAARYAILKIRFTVTRGMYSDALESFFSARWEFFGGAEQGRLLNTLHRELSIIGDTLAHLATQLAQAVQLCVYLIVPLYLSTRIALTALGLSILFAAPLVLLYRMSYRLGRKNTEAANVLMGAVTEVLGAARLVLGFGRQRESRRRVLDTFDTHERVAMRSQTLAAAAASCSAPVGILSAVLALGVALQQELPMSEMAALFWSLLRAFPLLGGLMSTGVIISSFLPSYDQLAALRAHAKALREVEGDRVFTTLTEGIELRDVDFSYRGREATLSRVSLRIARGQTTAIVGESGAGKSTITDLILALQVPDRGEVLIDGTPMRYWSQNTFRERVGYVPQDPLLFNASIRENLRWSYPGATEADVWEACQLSHAADFIRALPNGLETVVGERGSRLSGGQRQRIALARALVRKPELLILDEATSSLDSESERIIQDAIDRLAQRCTLLVVAHRVSTIARANRVYVLKDGCVVEEGTYVELSKRRGGVFFTMADRELQVQLCGSSRSEAPPASLGSGELG